VGQRRQYVKFRLDYPEGHVPVSVAAIPFSQLTPAHEEVGRKSPSYVDRSWNGDRSLSEELRPEPDGCYLILDDL
jgi:hypothetical protein